MYFEGFNSIAKNYNDIISNIVEIESDLQGGF
jgi:hypothetical protein